MSYSGVFPALGYEPLNSGSCLTLICVLLGYLMHSQVLFIVKWLFLSEFKQQFKKAEAL